MPSERQLSKSTQFKKLLLSPQLEFICEAHNGLSAKIVEEAGFHGIWASGLSISAQFGVRDNNEASWTQVLDNLEFMSDATQIPILLDGDTGYGNFNNMQRLIRKLEQRQIAAVCIEDKLFPKTNSFLKGEAQPLADMDEFCGKIKAGKDAQSDPDFCIIARVEAFICGWGLAEALRRAEAYHRAGADGILIHSALAVPDEILAFKREWGDRCPVVIVPTKFAHVGEAQPLADMDEFCGKIKAGKDAQSDPDFCIIARVEAFICGWGLAEALRRAEAYHRAGADGILIHSALAVPDEILAFKREWGDRCPVVIVPTKYYSTPTDVFRQHGISLVIWANHMLRAAIATMQSTARILKEQENLLSIEDKIVPVSEIFRLQGAADLQEAEKRYLPKSAERASAIVLAASRGDELGELTNDKPKTMVPIRGVPILAHIMDAYNTAGIKDISVVRGYKKETMNLPQVTYVDNDDFATTGELDSLLKALQAKDQHDQDIIISYGDVLFNSYIPQALLQENDDFVIFVDSDWQEKTSYTQLGGFAECTAPNSRMAFRTEVHLKQLSTDVHRDKIHGVWMGFLKVSASGASQLQKLLPSLLAVPENRRAGMATLFQELLKQHQPIRVLYTVGHWLDINRLDDVVPMSIVTRSTACGWDSLKSPLRGPANYKSCCRAYSRFQKIVGLEWRHCFKSC